MALVASLAVGLAGLLHLILAPDHYAHAPAHGVFFALAGIAELTWAVAFLRWRGQNMYYLGIVIAGALVVLWIITRFVPMPFEHEIGAVDLEGIATKAGEVVGIGALAILATQGRVPGLGKRSLAGYAAEAVVLAAFFGVGIYMVAHTVAPYMPFLGGEVHEEGELPEAP